MGTNPVTVQSLKNYLRIDHDEDDLLLETILAAGKQYISGQTGLPLSEWEEKQDLTIALMVLCCDMYDNRSYNVQSTRTSSVNQVIDTIISQYRMNLL